MLRRKITVQIATVACAFSLFVATGTMAEQTIVVKKKSAASEVEIKKLQPQTTCPIMGGEIDKNQYVDYNGKRIYVCCGGCIEQVKSDPEAAISKLAELGQEPETIEPAKPVKIESKTKVVKKSAVKRAD